MQSLKSIFEGWDGYNTSLARAVESLTPEQLRFQPVAELQSLGQIAAHIGAARVIWLGRIGAPGHEELQSQVEVWRRDSAIADDAPKLVDWLNVTWKMVEKVLATWSLEDLSRTYLHPYGGTTYRVSHQWTIWRVMCHDIHHGGQMTVLFEMLGLSPLELCVLGGHITECPVADQP